MLSDDSVTLRFTECQNTECHVAKRLFHLTLEQQPEFCRFTAGDCKLNLQPSRERRFPEQIGIL